MTQKEAGPENPTNQDLVAFARAYYRAYTESIEEKRPDALPKLAQDAPYLIRSYLLPNGALCMIFNSTKELKIEAGTKDWEDVQDIIVKGVDHFAGFYPFEGRSIGDWNKRGKKDALRDLRMLDKSELSRAGAELEGVIENITKMVKANPWLGKAGTEIISSLRSVDSRVRGGFPTVDAIAALQSLKAYSPGAESISIEFPDRSILEDIASSIHDLAGLESKIEAVENRMFEIEKSANSPDTADKVADVYERVERLEKQLEKVSNILTMLNSKVENYFSKSAEKERQAEIEKRLEEHSSAAGNYEKKIVKLEKEAEKLVEDMREMAAKMEKDMRDSRKRIARVEKHFVDFAKMVQE